MFVLNKLCSLKAPYPVFIFYRPISIKLDKFTCITKAGNLIKISWKNTSQSLMKMLKMPGKQHVWNLDPLLHTYSPRRLHFHAAYAVHSLSRYAVRLCVNSQNQKRRYISGLAVTGGQFIVCFYRFWCQFRHPMMSNFVHRAFLNI